MRIRATVRCVVAPGELSQGIVRRHDLAAIELRHVTKPGAGRLRPVIPRARRRPRPVHRDWRRRPGGDRQTTAAPPGPRSSAVDSQRRRWFAPAVCSPDRRLPRLDQGARQMPGSVHGQSQVSSAGSDRSREVPCGLQRRRTRWLLSPTEDSSSHSGMAATVSRMPISGSPSAQNAQSIALRRSWARWP